MFASNIFECFIPIDISDLFIALVTLATNISVLNLQSKLPKLDQFLPIKHRMETRHLCQ